MLYVFLHVATSRATKHTVCRSLIICSHLDIFYWFCSWNVSVLPEDDPLRPETCRSVIVNKVGFSIY